MKMIFFLLAFFLIGIRVYFSWSGKDKERRGVSECNLVIRSDHFYEEINYSGKFEFTEDGNSFKSISPGGYFRFRRNEEKVKAESNLQGNIDYSLYDGKNKLTLDDQGRKLISEAIREMFAWGYDAKAHMEMVYQKAGVSGLMSEVDSMKSDPVKMLYLHRLLDIDTLSTEKLGVVVNKIKWMSSESKMGLLGLVSTRLYKNPAIDSAYFEIVEDISSDMDKINALNQRMDRDTLSVADSYSVLRISKNLGSDMDKGNMYGKMIDRGLIQGAMTDSLIYQIADMGSDIDKSNLYIKLIGKNTISEIQWMELLDQTSKVGSDLDKADFLTGISQKMPKTEALITAFQRAARTITDDSQYGKVVRTLQQ